MAIYRRGTAGLTANGVVTGVDTKWQDKLSLIRVGATMVFLTQPLTLVTISAIVSDTEMRAIQTDGAVVPDGTNYVILLHDSITVDGLAQDVAETLRYYQSKETVIEEAIEFFKDFDLKQLQDLQAAVRIDADRTEVNASEAEESKNAAKVSETNAANSETSAGQSAAAARDDAARAKAEADRAATANPDNQLKKAANLSDLENLNTARTNIQVDRIRQDGGETLLMSPDKKKYITISNGGWRAWDSEANITMALPIDAGGTGALSADGARNNLGVGAAQAVRFANIEAALLGQPKGGIVESKRLDASGNSLISYSRMYHEIQADNITYTTLHTSGSGRNTYFQFGDEGTFRNVRLIRVGEGGIVSQGDVVAPQGKFIGVTTTSGGNKNITLNITPGDSSDGNWVNLLQGNWYNGYWQLGGVRGGSSDIKCVRLGVNSQGTDLKAFEFYNSYGGHLRVPRGVMGSMTQGEWAGPASYMGSAFTAERIQGNDAGYASIVSGGTQSTGGYWMDTSLGMIASGNNAWPRAVIKMLGDGTYHRGFEFHAPAGDIITWGQGGGWDQGFTFQKSPTSDRDLKWDIKYTEGKESYDRVMQWLPTMFKYKGSDTQRFGLIAQDLNKIDSQYVKIVPGAPIFEDVIGINENGEEYVDRQIETGFNDDTLALDSNVMLTDMACAMVYMGNKMEEMEDRLSKLEALLLK